MAAGLRDGVGLFMHSFPHSFIHWFLHSFRWHLLSGAVLGVDSWQALAGWSGLLQVGVLGGERGPQAVSHIHWNLVYKAGQGLPGPLGLLPGPLGHLRANMWKAGSWPQRLGFSRGKG